MANSVCSTSILWGVVISFSIWLNQRANFFFWSTEGKWLMWAYYHLAALWGQWLIGTIGVCIFTKLQIMKTGKLMKNVDIDIENAQHAPHASLMLFPVWQSTIPRNGYKAWPPEDMLFCTVGSMVKYHMVSHGHWIITPKSVVWSAYIWAWDA